MYGYDTLVAARSASFDGSLDWDSHSVRELREGVRVEQAIAHLGTCQVLYCARSNGGMPVYSEVRVQASLPKVLYGHNAQELSDPLAMAAAIAEVGDTAAAFLRSRVDLVEWEVRRVDVTGDRHLESEALVCAVLDRLSRIEYRGKLPVRGQDGSISWIGKRGGFTRKAYSKYRESGIAEAAGTLRLETGIIGQKALRRVLRRNDVRVAVSEGCQCWPPGECEQGTEAGERQYPPIAGGSGTRPPIVVADLLTEEAAAMREKALGVLNRLVEPVIAEVDDMHAFKAFMAFKAGDRRSDYAARMVGFAALVQRLGWDGVAEFYSRSTLWRIRQEYERVGIRPEDIEFGPSSSEAAYLQEVATDRKERGAAALALDILDDEWPLDDDDDEEGAGE